MSEEDSKKMTDFKNKFQTLNVLDAINFVKHLQEAFGETIEGEKKDISDELKSMIDFLKERSQVELVKFYNEIKEEWNIPEVAVAAAASGQDSSDEGEDDAKKVFTISITKISNKMNVVKAIKAFKKLTSLTEAMKLIAKTGPTNFEGLDPTQMQELKELLEQDKSNEFTVS